MTRQNGGFVSRLGTAIIAAIVGGVVSILIFAAGWVWSGVYEKLRMDITEWVFSQLEYKTYKSDQIMQHVEFTCPAGRLSTASCVGIDAGGNLQAAVGPSFKDDKTFYCDRYGAVPMKVQAFAICFQIKK